MSQVFAQSERVINASPETIYAVLSDYKRGRPLILTPNFQEYTVEKGGKGAGTVISYILQAARRTRHYLIDIEEPQKGQVLTERDRHSSLITTWSLTPQGEGKRTRVQITTRWEGATGVKGFFERTFAPLGLQRIYNNILETLALIVSPPEERPAIQWNLRGLLSKLALFGIIMGSAYAIHLFLKHKKAVE